MLENLPSDVLVTSILSRLPLCSRFVCTMVSKQLRRHALAAIALGKKKLRDAGVTECPFDKGEFMFSAYESDCDALLDWFALHLCFPIYKSEMSRYCVKEAARKGSMRVLERYKTMDEIDSNVCVPAAEAGRLELLRWAALKSNPSEWSSRVSLGAALGGHADILEWLYQNSAALSTELVPAGALIGSIQVIETALRFKAPDTRVHFELAAVRGHTEILALALTRRIQHLPQSTRQLDISLCYSYAAKHGRLDVIRELYNSTGHTPHIELYYDAASGGSIEVLDWLTDEPQSVPIVNSEQIYTQATYKNHTHVVRWAIERRLPCDTNAVVEAAIRRGNLDIVKLVYESRVGCHWPRAERFVMAVDAGALSILEWIKQKDYLLPSPDDIWLEQHAYKLDVLCVDWLVANGFLDSAVCESEKLRLEAQRQFRRLGSWKRTRVSLENTVTALSLYFKI